MPLFRIRRKHSDFSWSSFLRRLAKCLNLRNVTFCPTYECGNMYGKLRDHPPVAQFLHSVPRILGHAQHYASAANFSNTCCLNLLDKCFTYLAALGEVSKETKRTEEEDIGWEGRGPPESRCNTLCSPRSNVMNNVSYGSMRGEWRREGRTCGNKTTRVKRLLENAKENNRKKYDIALRETLIQFVSCLSGRYCVHITFILIGTQFTLFIPDPPGEKRRAVQGIILR